MVKSKEFLTSKKAIETLLENLLLECNKELRYSSAFEITFNTELGKVHYGMSSETRIGYDIDNNRESREVLVIYGYLTDMDTNGDNVFTINNVEYHSLRIECKMSWNNELHCINKFSRKNTWDSVKQKSISDYPSDAARTKVSTLLDTFTEKAYRILNKKFDDYLHNKDVLAVKEKICSAERIVKKEI